MDEIAVRYFFNENPNESKGREEMGRKTVSKLLSIALMVWILTLAFNMSTIKAEGGTIYIRGDGLIYPPTAPILNSGNAYYTFTNNIYDSIVVERDNIIVDGAGYTVQGTGGGIGIDLSYRKNVTVKNTKVTEFFFGIVLDGSSSNILSDNIVSNNSSQGIRLLFNSNSNNLFNNIASSNGLGIYLAYCSNNTLSGNTVENGSGIQLDGSSNNTLSGNTVENGSIGIYLDYSSNNNNISGNTISSSTMNGIRLASSVYNLLSSNTVSNNLLGIVFIDSRLNIVSCNTVYSNSLYGILLNRSGRNQIFHNNFLNNGS